MAGNSGRRGAVRKPGTKKGPVVGSGGQGKRALKGKGPTPKAVDRPYHPAAKRAAAQVRRAVASGKGKSPRDKATADFAVGRNPVLEALEAGVPATQLLVASGLEQDQRVRRAVQAAALAGIPVMAVTRAELDRRVGSASHQGVALKVAPYEYAHPADLWQAADDAAQLPLIVALDGVTDPHNLGAVLRSAAAFGAHGVLVPSRRSAGVGATAWKVSAGAAARLPVARATNLVQALQGLKERGAFVVGLDAGGAEELAGLALADQPLVLVTGSEGKGLARLTRQVCDVIVSIPMAQATESLNAAVATGIALYQVAQLRR